MKKFKYICILSIVVVIGIVGLIASLFSKKVCWLADYNIGDAGTWFSGVFTALAVVVAFYEIVESRNEFEREHLPYLKLFATYHVIPRDDTSDKDINENGNVPVETLQITPFNVGYSSGTYRFLGVFRTEDKAFMQEVVDRARQSKITNKMIIDFDKKIYAYDQAYESDIDGTILLYPTKRKVFENIKAGEVGKIQNLDIGKILKRLNCSRDTKLSIIYVDGILNSYIVDVNAPKSSDDPNVVVNVDNVKG